jgi:hypothetical protein
MEKEIKDWELKEWYGNPDLGLNASVKSFKYPSGYGSIPVWVWGKENNQHKLPPPCTDPDYVFGAYNFTVRAGANSDFSYTGLCVDCFTMKDAQAYVENLYKNKKLIR